MKLEWADENSAFNSPECTLKHSNSARAKYDNNLEYRYAVGSANRGKIFSGDRLERMSLAQKVSFQNNPQRAIDLSNRFRKLWEDPEFARKVLCRRSMSGPEKEFEKIVINNNLPYKFVGNVEDKENKMVISGKIPDFCHISQKKLIEIWGNYFHKGQDPQDRIDFFKKHGYNCIVIWANELKDKEKILEKVNEFTCDDPGGVVYGN
jgi:very-short-patch-repair endonuclease